MTQAIALPAPDKKGRMSLEQALDKRRSYRQFPDRALTLKEVSQLLWAVQGETTGGGRRTAPSAGATYPLETYLVAGNVKGLNAGLYYYDVRNHQLVLMQTGDLRESLSGAALGQRFIAEAPASVVLAAVYRRTAGRYGQRAERYVHMEIGHAGQNIYLQAESLGMGTVAVGAFNDAQIKSILQIQAEPLYLMPIGWRAR
ncbi:MAG TPA: SagB/ThcOx family dehydrogenase [Deltaproteobacteria bacterium]|nr:SagB/ThcOx family dehydrogenase [Deltaproteobacteria bacterium]